MPENRLTCPSCDAVLKTANSVAPGRKIRCPKCATLFAVPDEEDEEAAPVRSRSKPAPASQPPDGIKSAADRTQAPVRKKGRADDDGEEVQDDRPRLRKRLKKSKAQPTNPALIWGLVGGGVLLVVVAGIGVLVLTGVFSKKPEVAKGPDTPAAPSEPKEPPAVPEAGGRRWLSDLPERNAKVGWGSFGKHGRGGFEDRPILVGGTPSPHGLGMHPHASVEYHLDKKYKTFQATVALNDSAGPGWRRPIVFQVLADGNLIWQSRGLTRGGEKQECVLNIEEVDQLALQVIYEPRFQGPTNSAHAVWLEPFVDVASPPAGTPPPRLAAAQIKARTEAVAALEKLKVFVGEDQQGRVNRVQFYSPKLSDAELIHLKALTDLEDVEIVEARISDAGLLHLKGLSKLHRLSLNDTPITDTGLANLKELPQLKELELWRNKITDAGLVHLKGLPNLERLTLRDRQFTEAALVHLQGLTKLQALSIQDLKLTDAGLERLIGGLPELKELVLEYVQITDAALAHLKRLPRLHKLHLDSMPKVTDDGMVHLAGLTGLKDLLVSAPQVTDAGLARLTALSQLESLYVSDTQVTDAGLVHLKSFSNLKFLSLGRTLVTDAGLVHLKELRKLAELRLHETQVTDAGLVHLKALPSLVSLNLYRAQVTDAGLEHLKGLPQLQSLIVSKPRITSAGVKSLQQALPNCYIQHH